MTHEHCSSLGHLGHGNRTADIIARAILGCNVSLPMETYVKRGGLLSCCRGLHRCCSQRCAAARRATRRGAGPLRRAALGCFSHAGHPSAGASPTGIGADLKIAEFDSAAAGPRTARSRSRGAARTRAAARRATGMAARAWALASRRAWSPTAASSSWSSATQVCAPLQSKAHIVG